MMRRAIGAIFAAALIAQPATASEQEQVKEKRICKEETKIGSKIARKVCRTAAEWEALAAQSREAQEAVKDFSRRSSYGTVQ